MPSDTIPEHDWTGQHRVEELVEQRAGAMVSAGWRKTIIAVIIGVAVTGIGGLGTSWVASQQAEARAEEREHALERRLTAVEGQLGGIGGLSRDVAALSAKVDAWRQSDTAATAADRAAIQQRLQRIEDRLDRARMH